MNVNEQILQAGWLFEGACRCGGVRKEKYKKGYDKLIVYPTRNRFLMKKRGQPTINDLLQNISASL